MRTDTHLYGNRNLTVALAILPGRAAGLLALALLTLPLDAQMGLGLTPMKVEFPATPGRAYSGTLSLSNSTARKVRVRTEILDFYVDANQTPQFLPDVPAEAEYSCRQWISVNPMEVEMEPSSHFGARYTVRIPSQVKEGSHHCAIGFVSLPTNEDLQGIGVRMAVRVVTTLYALVGQPKVTGEIAELALEPVSAGGKVHWRAVVAMDNPGLMLYRPQGRVEVVDDAEKVIETASIASSPVLPKRRQRFLLQLKNNLAPGRYKLRATVDLGSEVQEASADVSVAPPKE